MASIYEKMTTYPTKKMNVEETYAAELATWRELKGKSAGVKLGKGQQLSAGKSLNPGVFTSAVEIALRKAAEFVAPKKLEDFPVQRRKYEELVEKAGEHKRKAETLERRAPVATSAKAACDMRFEAMEEREHHEKCEEQQREILDGLAHKMAGDPVKLKHIKALFKVLTEQNGHDQKAQALYSAMTRSTLDTSGPCYTMADIQRIRAQAAATGVRADDAMAWWEAEGRYAEAAAKRAEAEAVAAATQAYYAAQAQERERAVADAPMLAKHVDAARRGVYMPGAHAWRARVAEFLAAEAAKKKDEFPVVGGNAPVTPVKRSWGAPVAPPAPMKPAAPTETSGRMRVRVITEEEFDLITDNNSSSWGEGFSPMASAMRATAAANEEMYRQQAYDARPAHHRWSTRDEYEEAMDEVDAENEREAWVEFNRQLKYMPESAHQYIRENLSEDANIDEAWAILAEWEGMEYLRAAGKLPYDDDDENWEPTPDADDAAVGGAGGARDSGKTRKTEVSMQEKALTAGPARQGRKGDKEDRDVE
jgi:hypothetical protein